MPLGGKPASLRAGGGRGPAKAAVVEPRPAPRRKEAKAVLARASRDQATAGRAPLATARAKATQRAAVVEPPTQAHAASRPVARDMQRPAAAAGLSSAGLDASHSLMPHVTAAAQAPRRSLREGHGLNIPWQPEQHAPQPLRGSHSASLVTGDRHEPQPASPGAVSGAADQARKATAPPSPPGVVLDQRGIVGEGWPGSSAGGSSVGEEGPQVLPCPPRQLGLFFLHPTRAYAHLLAAVIGTG